MNEKLKQKDKACRDPKLGALFLFYLNSDVTEDERRRIESHLSHCPECKEELRFFETLKQVQKKDSATALKDND